MKKLLNILLLILALPLLVNGQSNGLLEKAYLLREKGELKEAALVIDQAVETKKGSLDPKIWHFRGFIYKDIYLKLEKSDRNSAARETAIISLKKSIEYDKESVYKDQSFKVLKLLAVSYFNDAFDIIVERNPLSVDEANDYYQKYRELLLYQNPDTVMTDSDIEFYLAMSTVHRKIYEQNRETLTEHNKRSREYLRLVLELDPDSFAANYSLSVSYYNGGARNLEKLPEATSIPDIYEIQAESMHSIEMALPFMTRAHEINPEKIEAIKGLKWILFNLHREVESSEMEEKEREMSGGKNN